MFFVYSMHTTDHVIFDGDERMDLVAVKRIVKSVIVFSARNE